MRLAGEDAYPDGELELLNCILSWKARAWRLKFEIGLILHTNTSLKLANVALNKDQLCWISILTQILQKIAYIDSSRKA